MFNFSSRNDLAQRNPRFACNCTRICRFSRRYAGLLRMSACCFALALPGYGYVANAAGTTTDINFSGGFATSQGQVILNGSAAIAGTALQLTNGGQDEAG